MDITPYVDSLRGDLVTAAESGGSETRAAAERLSLALEPAMRMALMDALSEAAAEITADLGAGSVEVRLRGREPQFVVDVPTVPLTSQTTGPETEEPEEEADEGPTTRITLRLPESVKSKAEELAASAEVSLNSWIVRAIRRATRDHAINVDIDLSSIPFLDTGFTQRSHRGRSSRKGRRMSGWV